MQRRATPGRPVATSHEQIERAAFRLFADRGFDGTTLDAIATEVGVGRRTLFRYFESKNDIPWGRFSESLESFREILADDDEDAPLHVSVQRGVIAFNDFDDDIMPLHRQRMELILTTPTLQAHSVHQYAAWRQVIAEHVARRLGIGPDDLVPQLIGRISLALAMTAYEQWLADDTRRLVDVIDETMAALRTYVAGM